MHIHFAQKLINMKEQHFGNHARYVPLFHFVTLPLVLAAIVGATVNLVQRWSDPHQHLTVTLVFVLSIIVALLAWYARAFALKAQDRAIRAEEQLRYFMLTGKRLDARLRLSQWIALRFADDEEFLDLVQRAASEQLSAKQIKQAIRKWKADWNRV
jgi:L-cystine uptake protein TcyP (sodium:dicarboxylate symporter family)